MDKGVFIVGKKKPDTKENVMSQERLDQINKESILIKSSKETLLTILLKSFLAGCCIGLGGLCYLSCSNAIVGTLLFSLGLLTICTRGYYLFTGKACYPFKSELALIWVGNFLGTATIGVITYFTKMTVAMKAYEICNLKFGYNWYYLVLLGFLCNLFIFISVKGYKDNEEFGKYLSLVLGVMGFIISGTEHCIADMYYLVASNQIVINTKESLYVLLFVTIGNLLGGIILRLLDDKVKR